MTILNEMGPSPVLVLWVVNLYSNQEAMGAKLID